MARLDRLTEALERLALLAPPPQCERPILERNDPIEVEVRGEEEVEQANEVPIEPRQ